MASIRRAVFNSAQEMAQLEATAAARGGFTTD
jgi:hypothetical protein